jgi:hypothetical protein
MSEGQILKPDKDFSKEVNKQLPEAEQLAQVCRITLYPRLHANNVSQSNVQGAIEKLTALEKQTRQVRHYQPFRNLILIHIVERLQTSHQHLEFLLR